MAELERHGQAWIFDGEIRQLSQRTIGAREFLLEKLTWFLEHRNYDVCGLIELRDFLAYVAKGHEEPGGRWGNPSETRPVRPRTIQTYYINLGALFHFLVQEGVLAVSPMDSIRPPKVQKDQVIPPSEVQINDLLDAARSTRYPLRDEAVLLLLIDSGLRASELCGLRVQDMDLKSRRCRVLGKGNKYRSVFFSATTARALLKYLNTEHRKPEDPLFLAESSEGVRRGFTRSGLLQLVSRLGKAAGIDDVRCSPHSLRHFMAVEYLRAGGNSFSLRETLGHTTLAMTNRYVAVAEADLAEQHRQHSPVERLRRGK